MNRLFSYFGRIAAAGLLLTGLVACHGRKVLSAEEAALWIEAFTPGRISADMPVRVRFASAPRFGADSVGIADKALVFSPKLKGDLCWEDGGRTLVFFPSSGALNPGKTYECRVRMGELFAQAEGDFVFSFTVAEREAELHISGVGASGSDPASAVVTGSIRFSEPVDASLLTPDLIGCDLPGSTPEAEIHPTDDGALFAFSIFGLPRSEEDVRARVVFGADRIGYGKSLSQPIVVPGTGEFKVLFANMPDRSEPCIEVGFSAPLDPRQDLRGLIALGGARSVKIERESTLVKLRFESGDARSLSLSVDGAVRSGDGRRLGREFVQQFQVGQPAPAVEIPLSGTILPDESNLVLPFRAVNLAAVDVKVVKIYTDNVLSFLQDNDLDGRYNLRRYGRLVYHRTVRLDGDPALDLHEWQNFSVDLSGLFRQEKGAVYSIRLSFREAYSLYGRDLGAVDFPLITGIDAGEQAEWDRPEGYYYAEAEEYDGARYNWKERDDPSKPTYYMCAWRFPQYNLTASNLGLIVKSADSGRLWTAVSDIMTAQPVGGVQVTAYDFQLRSVGGGVTDGCGFADFAVSGRPFVVAASRENTVSYLKVTPGREKSLSRFDVGGEKVRKGLKSFIYGERGVWRPADSVHLTLIVEDRLRELPAGYPVTMEVFTPQGQFFERQTLRGGSDGFYPFAFVTHEDSPTGSWEARFKVGGETFRKSVRIETIKPNRLKIDLATASDLLQAGDTTRFDLAAHWLTGPAADGLAASVEMAVRSVDRPFADYSKFVFSNPLVAFSSESYAIGSGKLDSCGRVALRTVLPAAQEAPGMLRADLICSVFETGGDASIVSYPRNFSPFRAYVGVDLGDAEFETDSDLRFPVVAVDPEGHPLSGRKLEYTIYKIGWSWWWEHDSRNLGSYVQDTSAEVVASGSVVSAAKAVALPFRVDYPGWGRYLLVVKDRQSGHLSGGVFTVDWPSWRGRSDKSDPNSVSALSFSLDKRTYEVGEEAAVYVPASGGGRALVCVENSAGVLSQQWVDSQPGCETLCKIKVTKELAPNFYVHVTLLQPHGQTLNDSPVRLYGVQSAVVTDPASHLDPQIDVAEVVRPQEPFTIKVSERNGRPMTYTLALVDEGLLDITGFRTPDPWSAFNRREALGVATWDLYDEVIGAYGGKFSKVLSIGGDENGGALVKGSHEKRFNPVVRFLGPFTLRSGSRSHRIVLPMYVGSVRAMVVAGHGGAYGHADKSVVVRSPLMVMPTLPRRLACGEKVSLPVNVFAMEPQVRNVQVSVSTEGPVEIVGPATRKTVFAEPSDKLVNFMLRSDPAAEGTARVTVTARSGGYTASETIALDVVDPNPPTVVSVSRLLAAKEACDLKWEPFRSSDPACAQLEIAAFPAIDFGGTFDFVYHYSHLCSEQLSARALYLLHARRFLDDQARKQAETLIPQLLRELFARQLSDGGFAYWPGDASAYEWVTSMAGQAIVEAEAQGFSVPRSVGNAWLGFQKKAVRNARPDMRRQTDLQQAYRLYTLALAKNAEVGAMNKLRESASLSLPAQGCLSAAYALTGKLDAAAALLDAPASAAVSHTYATFGSDLRDKAIRLEALVLARRIEAAFDLAADIAAEFSPQYCSTQEVAFVSAAMGRLAENVSAESVGVRYGQPTGKSVTLPELRTGHAATLDPVQGSVHVENLSDATVSARIVLRHKSLPGERIAASSRGVALSVQYTDLQGRPVDVAKLRQGQEFRARIDVRELTATRAVPSMALSLRIPSGWEIWNDRLLFDGGAEAGYEYKDIRDDRVDWYFGLPAGGRKSFTVRMRAAYAGEFVLPAVVCEDMYNVRYRATTAEGRAEVTAE